MAHQTAREKFRVGQPVREVGGGRRGVVLGFTPHPGGLVVGLGGGRQHFSPEMYEGRDAVGAYGLPAGMVVGRPVITLMPWWEADHAA